VALIRFFAAQTEGGVGEGGGCLLFKAVCRGLARFGLVLWARLLACCLALLHSLSPLSVSSSDWQSFFIIFPM
jgi:hypothetical protein